MTPRGEPLRYEEYYRSGFVAARGRRIFREFSFLMLGALILLALIQLPLAWRLGRRLRESQRERLNLLQRAVDASELERRRIAGDLHDGVVQNLAGVSYALSAAANSAPPELASTLNDAADETRQGIRELRSLLVEIYPPELQREGLEAALGDLLAPALRADWQHAFASRPTASCHRSGSTLLPRRPGGLRNVVKHSGAHSVEVEVARQNGRGVLRVTDDGSGFDPELEARRGAFRPAAPS